MATDLVFNGSYTPPIGSRVILDFNYANIDWNIASIGSVSAILATPKATASVIGEGSLYFTAYARLISASMMTAGYSIPTIWMDKVGTYEIKYY